MKISLEISDELVESFKQDKLKEFFDSLIDKCKILNCKDEHEELEALKYSFENAVVTDGDSEMNNNDVMKLLQNEIKHIESHLSFSDMDIAYYEYWGKQKELFSRCMQLVSDNNKLKQQIPAERNKFLSDNDINILNAYLDDCIDTIAFGNSDFTDVYDKIVGDNKCKKRLNWYEILNN